jgi:DNA-binding transcriptional LysR family regulator
MRVWPGEVCVRDSETNVGGVGGEASADGSRTRRRPRLQPSIESVELYDRICDCIQTGTKETLKGVARALGCALSGVCACLKTWKDIRGAELVNLAVSPIVLLPPGKELHRMAKAVLAAHQVMRRPDPPGTGEELVIGAANVFVRHLLSRVTARFYTQTEFTGMSIRLIEEHEGAIRALEDGEAQFVLGGSSFRRRHPWLLWESLRLTLGLVAITRKKDAPRASPQALTEEALQQRTVCLQEDDARLLRLPRRIVVTNYASIMDFVREAGVVGIVPVLGGGAATGIEDYHRDFRVFGLRLNTPIEPWELGVWTRQNVTLSRSAAAYLGVLRTFLGRTSSRPRGGGTRST